MNAVGIDISKGKCMVAAMRPFGEVTLTPREVTHSIKNIFYIQSFCSQCRHF